VADLVRLADKAGIVPAQSPPNGERV
jgi:hypothetical protein